MRHIVLAVALLALPSLTAAQEHYDPTLDAERYRGCVQAVKVDPARVEQFALEWQTLGGALPAQHCLALAQLAQGKNAAAARTLAKAARDAEVAKSPLAADFWGQAGNAALLNNDPATAIAHFGSAIVDAEKAGGARLAGLLVDRARARVDSGDLKAAREDLDRALALDEKSADSWLLSAALAQRSGDNLRARGDVARAAELAPGDANVLLEQGNIAAASGQPDTAREYWHRAETAGAGSEAGRLANQALAAQR